MKQRKYNDKRRNSINLKNKRITTPAAYKSIKSTTKDYQKSNYDIQTDNKKNNRNIDMSMGLEDKKKLETKTMDQKQEKPSLPKEGTTTTTSSQLATPKSEVFDSSGDNAISEMKKVAGMGPDETSKVFSHLEEKQPLDPLTTSVNDDIIKRAIHEHNLTTNPVSDAEKTLQERDRNIMESKEEGTVLMKDVKPDVPQDYKDLKQQDSSGESVRFSEESNKEYYYPPINNDENNNPFISGIKLWQAYNEIWFNAYNGYMKTWRNMALGSYNIDCKC